MPTYLDSDIAGDGQDVFPSNQVIYLVVHVTTLGDEARIPALTVPDQVLRFGWLALGDSLDVGDGARDYWREPLWINFLDTMWTPDPSTLAGSPLVLIASRIRWHLSVGAAAHLYVFGG